MEKTVDHLISQLAVELKADTIHILGCSSSNAEFGEMPADQARSGASQATQDAGMRSTFIPDRDPGEAVKIWQHRNSSPPLANRQRRGECNLCRGPEL